MACIVHGLTGLSVTREKKRIVIRGGGGVFKTRSSPAVPITTDDEQRYRKKLRF